MTVPMQGSGTFAVEAMLTTFVPRDGAVLVADQRRLRPARQAHSRRSPAARLSLRDGRGHAARSARSSASSRRRPRSPMSSSSTARRRAASSIRSTRSPRLCARHGRRLLIDAMSAFGALALDARETPFDAVAASANKCLEGVPGLGFVVCRREALAETEGNATTLSLDLLDQRRSLEQTGQWRFTPPIHVIVAFHQALGGILGRGRRRRPRRALRRERANPDRRHALARLRDAAARRAAGADHRDLPHAEPTRISSSSASTIR